MQSVTVSVIVHGTVLDSGAAPIAGVNVFLREALDGALTDSSGKFTFRTHYAAATATLIARRLGFDASKLTVSLRDSGELRVVLTRAAPALTTVAVQAGRYTAGDTPGATLTALEVVSTPGTEADVNMAIQTLPGVQQVDEGNGLYVRGGDYTETKVFLNDAATLTPAELQRSTGTFQGTVDPFLLDGIFFSSGGFGARYGDALSGVVGLKTEGRPARSSATASAGLAALSASGAVALPYGLGLRVAANRFDLAPFVAVNGSRQRFDPAPRGHDLSESAIWQYSATGRLTLFSIDQTNTLGAGVDQADYAGTYRSDFRHNLTVLSWKDFVHRVLPSVSVATTRLANAEGLGSFQLDSRLRMTNVFGQLQWPATSTLTARVGGETEWRNSAFAGRLPAVGSAIAPGAQVRAVGSSSNGVRDGEFAEADMQVGSGGRIIAGVRSDRSTLTRTRTVDPRLSAAVQLFDGAAVTAAWGMYHQVPDPLFFDPTIGHAMLRSMRADQTVLGLQLGEDGLMGRVELYDKRYSDLAQQTRNYSVVAGGRGAARGADVFLKAPGPFGTNARITYSHVASTRTDPNTGVIARAPFDISNSITSIVERQWGTAWHGGAAYRYATGRPITPVIAAAFDSTQQRWTPVYGAPMAERLPGFNRIDLSLSYLHRVGPILTVLYGSVDNALDRVNVYDYAYSLDYRSRRAVPSLVKRSLYVGATLLYP
ncbi:MAG: TonB-dependent receptor [Gemmatimonadota bacterium]|nr:TonB-dependent receptor [Gemmatimonadota bacterium]